LTDLKAQGQIDIDIADSLIGGLRTMAQSIVAEEELKLKYANSPLASKEQTIQIEGGLPALPGTNVIMPELNGHNGHVIEGIPAPVPVPEPKAQDPQP
jgi:hypothetical protein